MQTNRSHFEKTMHLSSNTTPIAIIGSGKIGNAVAKLLLRAGHPVTIGSRAPSQDAQPIEIDGRIAEVLEIKEAIEQGEIVVLAVPYGALDALIPTLRSILVGKIVIDATNPFAFTPEGRIVSSIGPTVTAGSRLASLIPDSTVVRAFSHIAHELLLNRGLTQPGIWAMGIAADDRHAGDVVSDIVRSTGFEPVNIGSLAESFPIEPGGVLFPHLFTASDLRAML